MQLLIKKLWWVCSCSDCGLKAFLFFSERNERYASYRVESFKELKLSIRDYTALQK